jgi:hypothetical protein
VAVGTRHSDGSLVPVVSRAGYDVTTTDDSEVDAKVTPD